MIKHDVQCNSKIVDTSSVVKSFSLMGKEAGSSKLMEVTVPRISRGTTDQIYSAAVDTLRRIETPSSYLM